MFIDIVPQSFPSGNYYLFIHKSLTQIKRGYNPDYTPFITTHIVKHFLSRYGAHFIIAYCLKDSSRKVLRIIMHIKNNNMTSCRAGDLTADPRFKNISIILCICSKHMHALLILGTLL